MRHIGIIHDILQEYHLNEQLPPPAIPELQQQWNSLLAA